MALIRLSFSVATEADVSAITELRNAATERLNRDFGAGHWSGMVSDKSVLRDVASNPETSRVLVARSRGRVVGTLRLAAKKPWAIDASYFAVVKKSLYLVDMAVAPGHQRRGVGRQLLDEALRVAQSWPAEAIRLDAYDAQAGAGEFYARCGFREVGRVTYRGTPLIYFEKLLTG